MGDGFNPFPNYPHVGPGNSIREETFNRLDAIARDHDIRYNIATSFEEIQEADKTFIKEISQLPPQSLYEWCVKWIAKSGILLKFNIENIIGPIYPRLNKRQQYHIKLFTFYKLNRNCKRNSRQKLARATVLHFLNTLSL